MMIKQYKIKLKQDKIERFSYYWGYQFYGMLMEKMNQEYVSFLHSQKITPISQYILPEEIGGVWTVNLFGKEIIEEVSPILDEQNSFYMANKEREFQVTEKKIEIIMDEKELMMKVREELVETNVFKLMVQTPMSFKSKGEYLLFPSAELIIKSLFNKWNCLQEKTIIDDQEAMAAIINGIKIVSYDLKSRYYHMKGSKIPAFVGQITLSVRLPIPLLEIVRLLMGFSAYSGIGIKNSLGMGGLTLLN